MSDNYHYLFGPTDEEFALYMSAVYSMVIFQKELESYWATVNAAIATMAEEARCPRPA